ncbi:hypothetical protein BGX24_009842 [Mortierella sp. AD032]|nr:hypothetical protein BGX24_009842 [Mortierella sp. AD032]
MHFTKNLRSFTFVAVVASIMLLASISVEAAPTTPDAIACRICDEVPECGDCPTDYYCSINTCTCRAICKIAILP